MVPTFVPFTFHWYDGVVPPLVGVAVNVTDALAHTVVVGVVMLTDGVTEPLMVIVIVFEVAVVGDAHAELDVMTHVTV